MAGNLPYYLTSEILLQLMRERSAIASAVVMVQDEVAERLVAEPGTKAYGSLTVTLGLAFHIELLLKRAAPGLLARARRGLGRDPAHSRRGPGMDPA